MQRSVGLSIYVLVLFRYAIGPAEICSALVSMRMLVEGLSAGKSMNIEFVLLFLYSDIDPEEESVDETRDTDSRSNWGVRSQYLSSLQSCTEIIYSHSEDA